MDVLLTDPDRKDQMKSDTERKKGKKKKNQTILSMQQRERVEKQAKAPRMTMRKSADLVNLTRKVATAI